MHRHRYNAVALRVPLKSFFVLFLTLRYQDQHILLNHVACQIWHYQVFGCQLTRASSSPRPTTWSCHWFLTFFPCAMDAMDGDGGGRISAPGRKSDKCITFGGPHFANQPGRCWECEYIDFTYSMCIYVSHVTKLPLSMWELADMMIELLKL